MTGGSNNRYRGFSYDGEPIEPELAALGQWLDHDGGTWRRGLADEQRVAQRVMVAITTATAAPTLPAPPLGLAPGARTRPDEPGMPSQPGVARRLNQPRRRGPRREQRLLAIAAMLLVVVLLAVVLKALGPRQATPHPTATATATTAPSATSTPSFPGAWSVAGTVALLAAPTFAPSDPRVVYEAGVQTPGAPGRGGSATTTLTLQRSDDAGKTWHTLPLPPGLVVDNNLLDVRIVVGAEDVRSVYLYTARSTASCGLQGDRLMPALPLQPTSRQGSGGACLTQYRSGDGGATWTTLTLPVPGIITQVVYDGNGTLYALVAHPLYGSGNPLPGRLIASNDGGLSWHVADATLWAQGYGIVSLTVVPSIPGTDRNVSVWVVTDPVAISQSQQAAPQFQPWRSDDSGATWRLTFSSALPYQYSAALVAGAGPLYQLAPQPTTAAGEVLADQIPAVSTDGGATWTKPPTTGLPSGDWLTVAEPVASGTAIVVPFRGGSEIDFYAWQPGAASWRQVAPSLRAQQLEDLFVTSSGSKTTLWVVYDGLAGNGFTVASFALA